MSKQTDAKVSQGYQEECNRCGNCTHFTSERKAMYGLYTVEAKLRCSIGGFKVKKFGGCVKHERKAE